jgi:hypothetical protein
MRNANGRKHILIIRLPNSYNPQSAFRNPKSLAFREDLFEVILEMRDVVEH